MDILFLSTAIRFERKKQDTHYCNHLFFICIFSVSVLEIHQKYYLYLKINYVMCLSEIGVQRFGSDPIYNIKNNCIHNR